MFNLLEGFRSAWKEEVEDPLKVLKAIPDEAAGAVRDPWDTGICAA